MDRDYQTLRIGMQTLFRDLGIEMLPSSRIDNILSIRGCKRLDQRMQAARELCNTSGQLTWPASTGKPQQSLPS